MSNWNLTTPADYAAAYRLIREEMRKRVVGHDHAQSQLALAGVRHVGGHSTERLCLIGPSGCGKSTLTRTLADVLDVPWLLIQADLMSEQNWHGTDLTGYLEPLYQEHGARAARAVVVVDELDKLCTAGFDGTALGYRVGKQQSLLGLLGAGSEIPLGGGHRAKPDGMLIITAGVFANLPPGLVGPGDLLRLGLMHELVERMGAAIRLHSLSGRELRDVLERGTAPTKAAFQTFGYRLEIADATLGYVASRMSRSDEAGPRSALAWLHSAASRSLIELLEEGAPEGTRVVLRPDDVLVPLRSPGGEDGRDSGGSPKVGV